jgi:magnesium chelatase family protein
MAGVQANARVAGRWIDANTPVEPAARELLASSADRLALSARGYFRVLKVARTIADLDGASDVTTSAVAEALRFRPATSTSAVVISPAGVASE